jgi:hypothetical protein
MIEDEVKQTRCSTCDADHQYKQARTPSPRRPKTVAAIQDGAESFESKPVLAAPARPPDALDAPPAGADPMPSATTETVADAPAFAAISEPAPPLAAGASAATDLEPASDVEAATDDEGPVHRRLIRATLPRPEGHVPERKEPEFTIRQPGARGGHEVDGNRTGYRPKGQRQPGGFGGHSGGHSRFGGQRHGSGPHQQRQGGGRGPEGGQRGGRPDGAQRQGPGPGRRRGGR